ncbi:MAG: TonB-dependent receptor [Balneolaceae bacterium]|nr:TonB-dependent receptor [Balneolaceae bacterium]
MDRRLFLIRNIIPATILFALIIVLAGMNPARAQTGTVTGTIIDEATGETLPGAHIVLVNSSKGTVANVDGQFRLSKLPAGTQTFEIGYIGYHTKEVEVEVLAGQDVELNVQLTPDLIEGEEITLTGQALGQARAIQRQLNSNSIVSVVSDSRLRELPDANAAETVGRLPGVTILRSGGEGNQVAIRGLAPRYNSITVDGTRLPSSTSSGRDVDLNTISSEMLSGIEVYKSNRPDMDADAIGGTVNFEVARAPDSPQGRIKLGSGYKDLPGSNDLPGSIGNYEGSVSGSSRFLDGRLGVFGSLSFKRNDRSSDNFDGSYSVIGNPEPGSHIPLRTTSVRIEDDQEIRDRYGGGLMLDYELENGRLSLNNFFSRLDRDIWRIETNYNVDGFMQHWSGRDRHLIKDVMMNNLSGEYNLSGADVDFRISRSVSKNDPRYDHELQFREMSAFRDDELIEDQGPDLIPLAARHQLEETRAHTSNFRSTEVFERDVTAELNIKIPVSLGTMISGYVKLGGKHWNKHRWRENERLQLRDWQWDRVYNKPMYDDDDWHFTSQGKLSMVNFVNTNYKRPDFLNGKYNLRWGVDRDRMREFWQLHGGSRLTTPEGVHDEYRYGVFDDHTATERISAGYLMTELTIGSRLMILPGARYELENSDYQAVQGALFGESGYEGQVSDTLSTRNIGNLFPMVLARYNVTDWFDIRMAFTNSVARPTFGEVSPRMRENSTEQHVSRGNPQLKPTISTNYDLFLSFSSNRLGLVTFGGFYKTIENLIFTRNAIVVDPEPMGLPSYMRFWSINETVNNPNETTVHGIEFEWQSNLMFLPPPLNGLVINVNYSRFFSETQYPEFYTERVPGVGRVGVDTFRVGRMPHQADNVANLSVGYDYSGFSARFSMLYQGETLTAIGSRPETDRFTVEYLRYDATLRQRIFEGASVFINLHNIGNRPDRAEQFSSLTPTSIQYYGWSMDVGVRYKY